MHTIAGVTGTGQYAHGTRTLDICVFLCRVQVMDGKRTGEVTLVKSMEIVGRDWEICVEHLTITSHHRSLPKYFYPATTV